VPGARERHADEASDHRLEPARFGIEPGQLGPIERRNQLGQIRRVSTVRYTRRATVGG
jgi:hypothetical protein